MHFEIKLKVERAFLIVLLSLSLSITFCISPSVKELKNKNTNENIQDPQNSQSHNFTSPFIFNLSQIQHVKNYEFNINNINRMKIHGEFLFVVFQTSNIAIFNLSSPSSPLYLGSINIGDPISNFICDGNIMYLATQTSITIYNISNVESMFPMISYSGFTEILDFYIEGRTLYLLDFISGNTYLRIFTNKNWNIGEMVGQIMLGMERYQDIVKVHNTIIAGSNTGFIISINVLNPSSPTFIDNKMYFTYAIKLKMYGNMLYFFDINNFHGVNPTNFDDLANIPLSGISNYVLEGNIAYFAMVSGIIKIINTTRADRYESIVDLNVGASVYDLVLYDNYILFSTATKLYSVQVANETIPSQMLVENPGDVYQVRIFGEYAFIATSSELRIFNLRNNSYINFYNYLSQGVRDVYLNGRYLYVLYYSDVLRILDFSNPYSLNLINITSLGTYSANSMTAAHGYLFISRFSQGIKIVNISNPISADVIATIPTAGSSYASVVMNNFLYVANLNYISIYNITNIQSPVEIHMIGTDPAFSLELCFPYLYFGTQNGLKICDIKESIPNILSQYDIVGINTLSLKKSGDLLYCVRGTGGLQIMNVTTPQIHLPFHETSYLTGYSVDLTHNKAILSRNTNGWEIVKIRNTAVDNILGKNFIEALWTLPTNTTPPSNNTNPDDGSSNDLVSRFNINEILSFALPPLGIVIVIYLIVKMRRSKGPKAKKIKAMTNTSISTSKKSASDDFFDSEF